MVLAPLLLIELALALYFFAGDLRGFALPLFLAGAASTTGAYAVLLRCWKESTGMWTRFSLCLACSFAAFQVSLLAFAIVSGAFSGVDPIGFTLIVLIGGNVFFFPVWIVLGALAFVLLRVTNPKQHASRREAGGRLPQR